MNQKYLIVLLATICVYGVCSSPVDDQKHLSGIDLPKPSTISKVSADHISVTSEPTSAPSTDHSVPVKPKASNVTSPSEILQNTTALQNDKVNSSAVNAHSDFNGKNGEKTTITSQSADRKIDSQPVGSKDSIKPIDILNGTNSSAPARENSSVVIPPTDHKTVSPSSVPVDTTTTKTSPYSTTPKITEKTSTMKPTSAISTVESATTNSIIAEHNTPAPTGGSHFDGASFIGGIVLTIGLTAIGFIAFKYYKSGRIDMNYRTL